MLKRHGFVLLAMVVALAGPFTCGAESRGEVEEKIEALWDKVEAGVETDTAEKALTRFAHAHRPSARAEVSSRARRCGP